MGRREENKARMRAGIADAAAALFAARGYDDVLVAEVAQAAGVSEQTVYNYFPAKQDLVLDRAVEFRSGFDTAVRDRAGLSPAAAIRPLVVALADLAARADAELARGQYAALAVGSPAVRRFAVEAWDAQARSIEAVLRDTDPALPPMVARAHAAALVSVVRSVVDEVGGLVLAAAAGTTTPGDTAAARIRRQAAEALDDLDRTYRFVTSRGAPA